MQNELELFLSVHVNDIKRLEAGRTEKPVWKNLKKIPTSREPQDKYSSEKDLCLEL